MGKNNPAPVAEGKGDGYSYRQFGERYVVSVDNRRELVSVLERACRDFNVRGGEISGIGATDKATLRFFNPTTKKICRRHLRRADGDCQLDRQCLRT